MTSRVYLLYRILTWILNLDFEDEIEEQKEEEISPFQDE